MKKSGLASVPSLPLAPSELRGYSHSICPGSQPWALGALQVPGPASPLQGQDYPLGSLGLCLLTLASGPVVLRLGTLQPAGTSAVSIVCPFAHPHLCHTLPVLTSHLELAVLLFLPFQNLGFWELVDHGDVKPAPGLGLRSNFAVCGLVFQLCTFSCFWLAHRKSQHLPSANCRTETSSLYPRLSRYLLRGLHFRLLIFNSSGKPLSNKENAILSKTEINQSPHNICGQTQKVPVVWFYY